MNNPEIDLKAIANEPASDDDCRVKSQSEPSEKQLAGWTEEYAASGAVKIGGDPC